MPLVGQAAEMGVCSASQQVRLCRASAALQRYAAGAVEALQVALWPYLVARAILHLAALFVWTLPLLSPGSAGPCCWQLAAPLAIHPGQ